MGEKRPVERPEQPFVSVIVPTYDSDTTLRGCLDALEAQAYPRDRFEVLVVDNGSTATDPALRARTFAVPVRWLHEPRPGSYAARNAALPQARGDVLAFTDADCLPRPDWLANGVAALRSDPSLGMVAGHVEMFARDPRRPRGAELWDMQYGLDNREFLEAQHFAATANLFTWRHVMEAVGPFDADLKSGGDMEWGQRAHAAGVRQAFAADAVVRHPARDSLRALAAKTRRVRGGQAELGRLPGGWRLAKRWVANVLPPWRILPVARRVRRQHGAVAALRFYGATYYRRVVGVGEEIRIRLGGKARR